MADACLRRSDAGDSPILPEGRRDTELFLDDHHGWSTADDRCARAAAGIDVSGGRAHGKRAWQVRAREYRASISAAVSPAQLSRVGKQPSEPHRRQARGEALRRHQDEAVVVWRDNRVAAIMADDGAGARNDFAAPQRKREDEVALDR